MKILKIIYKHPKKDMSSMLRKLANGSIWSPMTPGKTFQSLGALTEKAKLYGPNFLVYKAEPFKKCLDVDLEVFLCLVLSLVFLCSGNFL